MGVIRRRIRQSIGLLTATAVEVVALSIWFAVSRFQTFGSASDVVGASVLAGGLFLAGLAVHGGLDANQPVLAVPVMCIAVFETLLWVGWLAAFEYLTSHAGVGTIGIGLAGLGLALLLVPLCTLEANVFRRNALFDRVVDPQTIHLSVVTAVGATGWLLVVTGIAPITQIGQLLGFEAEYVFGVGALAASIDELVGLAVLSITLLVENILAMRRALQNRNKLDGSNVSRRVEPITFQQE